MKKILSRISKGKRGSKGSWKCHLMGKTKNANPGAISPRTKTTPQWITSRMRPHKTWSRHFPKRRHRAMTSRKVYNSRQAIWYIHETSIIGMRRRKTLEAKKRRRRAISAYRSSLLTTGPDRSRSSARTKDPIRARLYGMPKTTIEITMTIPGN